MYPYRSLNWRLLLGAVDQGVDPATFVETVHDQRRHYEELRSKHKIRTDAEIKDVKKELEGNPLAGGSKGTEWHSYMNTYVPLLTMLRKDINRTCCCCCCCNFRFASHSSPTHWGHACSCCFRVCCPRLPLLSLLFFCFAGTFSELPYFHDPATREMLERILLVWSMEQEDCFEIDGNTESAYRQGMHELLAIIAMVLFKDLYARERKVSVGPEDSLGYEGPAPGEEVDRGERGSVGAIQDAAMLSVRALHQTFAKKSKKKRNVVWMSPEQRDAARAQELDSFERQREVFDKTEKVRVRLRSDAMASATVSTASVFWPNVCCFGICCLQSNTKDHHA